MKKFLLSLFALFSTAGAWAGVTDLPEITTDPANPIYYVIHNTRSTSGKFIYFDGTTIKDNNPSVVADSYKFYFTEGSIEGTVKIHNVAAGTKMLKNEATWDETGADCIIGITPYGDGTTGLYIQYGSGEFDCLNELNGDRNGYTYWEANDDGSIFVIEKVEDVYLPEAGKTYIVEAPLFLKRQFKMKGITVESGTPKWNTVSLSDNNFLWVVGCNATGQISLKNVGTGKYLNGTAMSDTEVFGNLTSLGQNQYNIGIGGITVHANGHGEGMNATGGLVDWDGAANSASAWKFVEPTDEEYTSAFFDAVPVPVTTDDADKKYFSIKSGRGEVWHTFIEGDKVHLNALTGADDQLWYFKATKEGDDVFLQLFPKNGGGKALSYENTTDGYDKIVAKALGTEGWTNTWRIKSNTGNAPYALQTSDEQNYYSNNSGETYNMGLWHDSPFTDTGTQLFIYTDETVYAELMGLVSEYEAMVSKSDYGYYKSTEAFNNALTTAKGLASTCAISESYPALSALKTAISGIEQIVPTPGFFRIKNYAGNAYLVAGTTGVTQFLANQQSTPNSVFYYDGTKLLSFSNGLYIGNNSNGKLQYTSTVDTGGTIEFGCDYRMDGKVLIYFYNGNTKRGLYSAGAGNTDAGGNITINSNNNYRFTLEPVTWLPVPMNTEVGYATLYSPVQLGKGYDANRVKVYTAEVNEEKTSVTLTEQDVVPANTGVILEYVTEIENGCVYLPVQETTVTDVTSDLKGTLADAYITPANETCYVLSKPETSPLAFYKAALNQESNTAFLNNGFKAYLSASAASQARVLEFDFGNATGIENVEDAENANGNATIYDLSGRRVNKAIKGIFIINGKKVIK